MGAEQQSHLAKARDILHQLVERDGSGQETGEQLFAVADLFHSNRNLLRALTDAGREPEDRKELAGSLLAGKVTATTLEVVEALVGAHWSHPEELVNTTALLGLDAYVLAADAEEEPDLSQQLVDVYTLIASNRDLRIQLSDIGDGDVSQRVALARSIFAGHVSPIALDLISRAVKRSTLGHLVQALRLMASRAAELNGLLLVICTTAQPLSEEQAERMNQLAARKWGQPVDLALVVDPAVVGGFRLDGGEEAIDTTVRSDIASARLALVR